MPEVRARLRDAQDRLSESNYLVGYFYFRQRWYPGAVDRFKELLKEDPGYTNRDAVYFYLAESLMRGGASGRAEALPYYERLVEEFEESEYLADATKRIAELKSQPVAVRPRRPGRRSARHRRRRVASRRSGWRAARAVRAQPAGRRADPADDSLVRNRRGAEGDVHLHRHRAVRLLGRGRRDCQRARSLRRNRADAWRQFDADRQQGAGRTGAARHLQEPAASLRPGVRLHHARRADQRRSTGSASC